MARIKYFDQKTGKWEYADSRYVVDSGGNANIYAGDTEPTNGSLMWIDTAEEENEKLSMEFNSERWLMYYIVNSGFSLSGNGSATATNEATYIDCIPVTPGKKYTLYSTDTDWSSGLICIGFVKDDLCSPNSKCASAKMTGTGAYLTFAIPEDCNYIIVSAQNLANDENYKNIRLVEGNYPGSEGESGGDTGGSDDTGNENTVLWYPGYFNTTGNLVDQSESQMYSDYIEVTPGDYLLFENTDVNWSTDWYRGIFYDADKGYMKNIDTGNMKLLDYPNPLYYMVVPDGACYVRMSCNNMVDYWETAKLYSGELPASHVAYHVDFEDVEWNEGRINSSGNVISDSSNGEMYCTKFSVEPGATYRFGNSNADWTTDYYWVAFFTNAITAKASAYKYNSGHTWNYFDIAVPEDVIYIQIASRNLADHYTTATLEKFS